MPTHSTRTSVLICILLSPLICYGQLKTIYTTEPNSNKYNSDLYGALYADGYFYISGTADDNYPDEPGIMKLDTTGRIIWNTTYVNPPVDQSLAHPIEVPNKMYLFSNGLYVLSHDETWKVNITSGRVEWKQTDMSFSDEALREFDDTTFIYFRINKIEFRHKSTGNIIREVPYTLAGDEDGWRGFCMDHQSNFYFAADEFILKYDSNFNLIWKIGLGDQAEVSDFFFHEPTGKLILTTDDRPRARIVTADSGKVLQNFKLWGRPFDMKVIEADLREPEFVYLLWELTTTATDSGLLVTKINVQNDQLVFNKHVRMPEVPANAADMTIVGDHIYITGISDYSFEDAGMVIAKLDKATGEVLYCRQPIQTNSETITDGRQVHLVNGKLHVFGNRSIRLNDTTNSRRSIFVLDPNTGDSINHYTYPGHLQHPTTTTKLFSVSNNLFVAINQLGDKIQVTVNDYNLNAINTFLIPNQIPYDVAVTDDRIAFITISAYEQFHDPYELDPNIDRVFSLYDYNGQLLSQKELEEKEDYDLVSHQGTIQVMEGDDPYSFWQVTNDQLTKLFESDWLGLHYQERFLEWKDSVSIFIEPYSKIDEKGLIINHYRAQDATRTREDTIVYPFNPRTTFIQGDFLYISAALFHHPTSIHALYKYDLLSEKIVWEKLDTSYQDIQATDQIIFVFRSGPGRTVINGIDPLTGVDRWQQSVPLVFNTFRIAIDQQNSMLLLYDYDDVELGVQYISAYTVSKDGVIAQPFRYTGVKEVNHMEDILPVEHNGQMYYLAGGAFNHPTLYKTAFLSIYNGNDFVKPIRVNVFGDTNEDGIKNLGERNIRTGFILSNQKTKTYIRDNDVYQIPRSGSIDSIQYIPVDHWHLTTDSILYLTSQDTNIAYFGINASASIDTISSIISVEGRWRCNTVVNVNANVSNDGSDPLNGNLKVIMPSSFEFVSSSLPVDYISADTLVYAIDNLLPGDYVFAEIKTEVHGEIQKLHTFTQLVDYYRADPGSSKHEVDAVSDWVRCSFDPNDKLVNPVRGDNNLTIKGEEIDYHVRFQNTGNDTAFRVEIIDTLSDLIDLSTFRFKSASHPVTITLNGNILRALFMPIGLPDSTQNYIGSQGYIHFSVRSRTDLENYSILENKASIYFDFNPPVLTNATATTLVDEEIVGTNDSPSILPPIFLLPNPARDWIFLNQQSSDVTEKSVYIFDVLGTQVLERVTTLGERIDVSSLSAGIYFVMMPGYAAVKLVIQ